MSPTAYLLSADQALIQELRRLAADAGAPLIALAAGTPPAGMASGDLLLCGLDQPSDLAQGLRLHAAQAGADFALVAFGALGEGPGRSDGDVLALPRDAEALVWRLERREQVRGAARRLGVIGAQGGLGASVFAAALARVAQVRGGRGLADLDTRGGGIGALLGIERVGGVRWPAVLQGQGLDIAALPRWRGTCVLTAQPGVPVALPPATVRDAIDDLAEQVSLLVLDIPRSPTGDLVRVARWCDEIVLLAGLEAAGVSAALSALERLADAPAPVVVVARRRSRTLTRREFSERIAAPVIALLRDERGLREDLAHGGTPADRRHREVARVARAVWRHLANGRRR